MADSSYVCAIGAAIFILNILLSCPNHKLHYLRVNTLDHLRAAGADGGGANGTTSTRRTKISAPSDWI